MHSRRQSIQLANGNRRLEFVDRALLNLSPEELLLLANKTNLLLYSRMQQTVQAASVQHPNNDASHASNTVSPASAVSGGMR